MGSEKTLVIGMFGFGVVGEGLYKVLKQTPTLKASIKKVCIKNTNKKKETLQLNCSLPKKTICCSIQRST